MRPFFAAGIFIGLCAVALPAFAAPVSEIHITPDGKFSAKNVVVMQKSESGTTFFGRVVWDAIFLRVTVLTAPGGVPAKITKNNGGAATAADVKVGDILSVDGVLAPGADSLLINATAVRDYSLNKEEKSFSGTVKSVDYSGSFVLSDKTLGSVTVRIDSNTIITRGVRTISLGEMAAGDKVLSASGVYDFETKTLAAAELTVYQDKAVFAPKNFEGKLKSLSSTALPTTMVVTIAKSPASGLAAGDYTVYLAANTSVMSKNKAATTLQRFTVGDSVRFYGAVRQTNLFEVDAEIVRNLSF